MTDLHNTSQNRAEKDLFRIGQLFLFRPGVQVRMIAGIILLIFAAVFPVQGIISIASQRPFAPIGSAAGMVCIIFFSVIFSIASMNSLLLPKRVSVS